MLAALARNPLFFAAALPLRTMPPLFNRYAGGEHYGDHVDGAVRALPGSQALIRTDVSATLFLCEPDEYDGGELIVADNYGEHEVKLAAGVLILYASTSVHRVQPVTRGERLCAFFWVQSMVRDDARRTMLFDLDRNIQQLRSRLGDCAETVGLTAHYHNLLRQWAETWTPYFRPLVPLLPLRLRLPRLRCPTCRRRRTPPSPRKTPGTELTWVITDGETMTGVCRREKGKMVFQLRTYHLD